jgi:hypothetical protein
MTLDKEDQVVVLYALHRCGGKGSKSRIIFYISENGLLKPREGDTDMRQTRETRVENDLAWARENLKEKKYLMMPKHGVWQITNSGRKALFGVARAIYGEKAGRDWFERCSDKFIAEMTDLGKKLSENTQPTNP